MFRPFRNFQSAFLCLSFLFNSVFCLIQFRLVGLKYSSNDGRTYYAEEIGERSLPNINSVVPVASFRSMSALSPIHAAVILLFLRTGLVPSIGL